jgi:hypothetical protein
VPAPAEIGHYRDLAGACAQGSAWREDHRRLSNGD